MKNFKAFLLGLFIAAAGVAGLALAQAVYSGYNPTTNLNGQLGLPVAQGPLPVASGAGCGTLATVQASMSGGTSGFQFTPNLAGCVITFTLPAIPPATAAVGPTHGLLCVAVDETTGTATVRQTAHTATSCTLTMASATTSDIVAVEVNGW